MYLSTNSPYLTKMFDQSNYLQIYLENFKPIFSHLTIFVPKISEF